MPTLDERFNTLEANFIQLKAEAKEAYSTMAHELTMLKGLATDAVERVAALRDTVEARLERVDERLDKVENRLERVDERLDKVEIRLGGVENQLATHTTMLAEILSRLPEKQ